MAEKKLKMCPDPECGKESPEEAETCIGCGLDFEGFSTFDKFLTVRERIAAAKVKKDGKPKKQSLLDSFKRGKQ